MFGRMFNIYPTLPVSGDEGAAGKHQEVSETQGGYPSTESSAGSGEKGPKSGRSCPRSGSSSPHRGPVRQPERFHSCPTGGREKLHKKWSQRRMMAHFMHHMNALNAHHDFMDMHHGPPVFMGAPHVFMGGPHGPYGFMGGPHGPHGFMGGPPGPHGFMGGPPGSHGFMGGPGCRRFMMHHWSPYSRPGCPTGLSDSEDDGQDRAKSALGARRTGMRFCNKPRQKTQFPGTHEEMDTGLQDNYRHFGRWFQCGNLMGIHHGIPEKREERMKERWVKRVPIGQGFQREQVVVGVKEGNVIIHAKNNTTDEINEVKMQVSIPDDVDRSTIETRVRPKMGFVVMFGKKSLNGQQVAAQDGADSSREADNSDDKLLESDNDINEVENLSTDVSVMHIENTDKQ